MTTLIACLLAGKGTWTHVARLMEQAEWDRIILITNAFGKERFSHTLPYDTLLIDPDQEVSVLVPLIMAGLKGKITGTEAALNLSSGNGNEHMATLAAILRLGYGVRLVMAGEKEFVVL